MGCLELVMDHKKASKYHSYKLSISHFRFPILSWKSATTCDWFQIIFIFHRCVNKIWTQTLVNPYNINHLLRQVPGFNIDIYIHLHEMTLLKPVTCSYQLPTHSTSSGRTYDWTNWVNGVCKLLNSVCTQGAFC